MKPRCILGFALAALALVGAGTVHAQPLWTSSTVVDETASWLAMRKVSVHCLTKPEAEADFVILIHGALAYVEGTRDRRGRWHPGKYAVFSPGLCKMLDALAAGDTDAYSVEELALAVLVLTHESGHLRGHRWSEDEAKTECWAIRHVGYVAHRLGVVDVDARRLLVAEAVAIHNTLSDEYKLPGCVLPGSR